ncbi:hypothetical protein SAMN04488121_102239 [Chitinophaga filiformis]|uniref:Uncharacterized protein n=1 Tax=Chitinophaga filiformis TaxID=104663 RepID=A0A1G7LZ82_CHIFI|nr:hypothetical protein SAMN04488121_102239 [Chitinophaga filiformis]
MRGSVALWNNLHIIDTNWFESAPLLGTLISITYKGGLFIFLNFPVKIEDRKKRTNY